MARHALGEFDGCLDFTQCPLLLQLLGTAVPSCWSLLWKILACDSSSLIWFSTSFRSNPTWWIETIHYHLNKTIVELLKSPLTTLPWPPLGLNPLNLDGDIVDACSQELGVVGHEGGAVSPLVGQVDGVDSLEVGHAILKVGHGHFLVKLVALEEVDVELHCLLGARCPS